MKQIKLKEQRMSTKKRSIEIFRLKLTNTPDATDATRFRLFPVWSHSISGRRTISQHPAIIVYNFINLKKILLLKFWMFLSWSMSNQ